MDNVKNILSALALRNEHWTCNNLITNDQEIFLKLISEGLIEPNGMKSRLTEYGKKLIIDLEK